MAACRSAGTGCLHTGRRSSLERIRMLNTGVSCVGETSASVSMGMESSSFMASSEGAWVLNTEST